jgi:SAM-dependent methyltransferase
MHAWDRASTLRGVASAAARKLGVLQPLDGVLCWLERIRNARRNRRFVAEHPGFAVPPAHLAYDAYDAVRWDEYLRGGREVATLVGDLVRQHLGSGKVRLLEWGCGPARIVRHLPELLAPGSETFGSDYNAETIRWCRAHVPGVTFVENALAPPLPFADGSLDCACGFSVLTHLSEDNCVAWVRELSRVVRSGGLLLLSTKGEAQQGRLLADERRKLLRGEPIFRDNILEGKKMYDTILPGGWVEDRLLSGLEVVVHMPAVQSRSHHEQDLWIVRKPERRIAS